MPDSLASQDPGDVLRAAASVPGPSKSDVQRAYRTFRERTQAGASSQDIEPALVAGLHAELLPILRELLLLDRASSAARRRLAQMILQYADFGAEGFIRRMPGEDATHSVLRMIDEVGYLRVRAAGIAVASLKIWCASGDPNASARWMHAVATAIIASLGVTGREHLIGRAFPLGLFHQLVPPDQHAAFVAWRRLQLASWLDSASGCCGMSPAAIAGAGALVAAACVVAEQRGFPTAGGTRRDHGVQHPIVGELSQRLDAREPRWLPGLVESLFHADEVGLLAVLGAVA